MAQRLVILLHLIWAWTFIHAAPPSLSGTIRGKVTDEATGEGLPWASVLIEGTTLGVATDADGNYELTLEPGDYRVLASYLGYVESAQSVTVYNNQITKLDFALTYGNDLATVTISVQASGQIAAINEQLASNKIVNVVSAEKMEELPDANVAESIGRLPGISLQRSSGEANKIVVRGLSPKYNNVTIGGVKMASTNDFDRSADLSLVTGEMLAGVEVSKSLRADMDADAIGGTIDLKIKAAQEGLHANGSAEGGYNQLGHSFNNYKVVGAVGNRFLDNRFGVRLQLSTERKQLPSHRFGGNYSSPIVFQELDNEGNLTGEKGYKLRTEGTVLTDQSTERLRDGGNLTLDYQSKWLDIKLFSLFNRKVDEGDSRVNTFRFTQPNEPFSKTASHFLTSTELWTHSLQNAFRLGRTTLNLTLAHSSANHRSSGQFFNFIELNTGADPINQEWLIFRQPAEVLALFGDTHVNDSYLQQMGFSESPLTDKNHDARLDWNIPFQLSQNLSCTFSVGGKYHRLERKSDNTQSFVDFQHGAGRARKEALIAMFPWINTNLSVQRGIAAPNFQDTGYDPGEFLDGRYQLGWGADIDLLTDIQDQYHPANVNFYQQSGYDNFFQDYLNREETFAGYAMAEINAGNKWMILPGIRYENEQTRYEGYHIEILGANANGVRGTPDSVAVRRKNAYFFPSLNLKYRMNPTVIFQGAVYRSATRPDFRRLSPTIVITEQPSFPFASGNPFLLPATAWNYDLGCLFHSNKLGLLTLNLFHKKVEGFIFTLNDYFPHRRDRIVSESAPAGLLDALPAGNFYPMDRLEQVHRTNIPFNNFEPATYSGLELSWQTNFWYLPGLWNGLVLDINLTLLRSETKYPYFENVVIGIDSSGFLPKEIIGYEYHTRSGRLVDQPSSILNLVLGWDYKGFSSRVSFRYQNNTLQNQDARLALTNSYYDTFVWVDISLKQRLTEHLDVFANLTNVSRHIDDYFIRFDGQTLLPRNSEQYGVRGQFGLTWGF